MENKKYTPCGGCGATEPDQRCIGCMHPFTEIKPDEPPVTAEWELINRIVSQWGNAVEMPNMEQWLKDYAAKAQPGPRWVKAADRLPGWAKFVEWRHESKVSAGKDTVLGIAKRGIEYFRTLEWLDESTPAGMEEDAVAFAEWLNSNFVSIENKEGEAVYVEYGPQEYDRKQQFRIGKLYELFKQQKESK